MDGIPDIGVGSRLFLTAAPGLEIGAELSPGHWWRQIPNWPLARRSAEGTLIWESYTLPTLLELACETVRVREDPHLPSRLDCLFLWMDEANARAWHLRRHVLRDSHAGLYEVEVITCRKVFTADMNLVSYFDGETVGQLLDQVRRYWRGEGSSENVGDSEVLLEGSVVVRRDLLARSSEMLTAMQNPVSDRAMTAALIWAVPGARPWSLQPVRASRYLLQGTLAAQMDLAMPAAGWIAVELEGKPELFLARRGTPPVLLRPGRTCKVDAHVTDLPPSLGAVPYRPILLCDRAAAHYWQLHPFWEGQLHGDWQAAGDGVHHS